MSSWTYAAKVDMTKLLELTRELGTVAHMMEDVADQVKDDVKKTMKAQGVYDTGALYESIESGLEGNTAFVRDGVSYGVYNEFGTVRMAARPFFVPAIERAGRIVEEKFTELMR